MWLNLKDIRNVATRISGWLETSEKKFPSDDRVLEAYQRAIKQS